MNYDHPKSFETSKLIEDIKILKSGKAVDLPDFKIFISSISLEVSKDLGWS